MSNQHDPVQFAVEKARRYSYRAYFHLLQHIAPFPHYLHYFDV